MASAAEAAGDASTSAAEVREKPVVVRVKRKPSQARPDAFCEPFPSRCSSLSVSSNFTVKKKGFFR